MLIGIDFLGVRSRASRAAAFAAHLLAADPGLQYRIYAHDDGSTDALPAVPNAVIRHLGRDAISPAAAVERIAQENPDRLDLLLVLDPFSNRPGYAPPPRPLHGIPVAAILYDLIPPRLGDQAPPGPITGDRLSRLRHYDRLLVESESDRSRLLATLALPHSRVASIGSGPIPGDACPAPLSAALRRQLNAAGLAGPFAYHAADVTDPEDTRRLIDAYLLMPAALRRSHQLVLTLGPTPAASDFARDRIQALGLRSRILLTGPLPASSVRTLYARCAAAVFPSAGDAPQRLLREAIDCGAPLVSVRDDSPSDLAAGLARILTDPRPASDPGKPARAAVSPWEGPAGRAIEALRALTRGPARPTRRPDRPRLAVFAPFGPKKSGIATYTSRLIQHLKATYTIDLFHDSGYVPEPALASPEFAAHDYRLFDRLAPILGYRGVLYQMGNSGYHKFLYETMQRHPGVTTLHDFCLAGFQWWYAHDLGIGHDHFADEVRHSSPARAARYLALLKDWDREPGGIQVACAKRGLLLNRRVFESSRRVVVHSPWCVDQVRRHYPELAHKAVRIPHGTAISPRTPARIAATRARFGLPQDALVLASFGFLTKDKMNNESVVAFAALAREEPRAVFALVGHDLEGGEARQLAESLGVADRVHFLGHRPDADFADLVAASDLGLALRRPPTYGETSGALLDLLRTGIPTIVTDVGTFSDYPSTVVRKVRWQADGPAGLAAAVRELALDPEARASLSRAALEYVAAEHTWERATAEYVDAIESAFAEREGRAVAAA